MTVRFVAAGRGRYRVRAWVNGIDVGEHTGEDLYRAGVELKPKRGEGFLLEAVPVR